MESEIFLASENPEKLRVVEKIWPGAHIVTTSAYGEVMPTNIENNHSYQKNAAAKARWLYDQTGKLTIADDSGMEIKGLDGGPGVQTRRWGGQAVSDEQLLQKTIVEITDLSEEERKCDFVICAVALCVRGQICVVEKDSGVLLLEPRGGVILGHPLASLLWIPEMGSTLAELITHPEFESKDVRAHKRLRSKILQNF